MRVVGFQIKIPLTRETTDAQKTLDKFGKGLEGLEKKTLPKLTKTTKEYLKTTNDGLRETESRVRRFGDAFTESVRKGLEGISRLNERLHRSRERIFGLKEAFEATAIGAATFFATEKLFEEGRQELRTRQRIRREFGGEAEGITEIAERTGRRGGIQGDEAARMLIPLAETLRDTVQAGARFRGMRGPLSAVQAEELRRKNLEVGANLMQRMAVLAPEMNPADIGKVMNDALTGPEGIRAMIASFNLSKRSRTLSEMNEKGEAFKALSPEERKRLGITKQGQFIQQADLVQLMLERSGFTAKAATDEMKTMDFQVKAIKASLTDAFGDVGAAMLSKLDGGLSKGGTLAERLNNYLDNNKETIKHIGESLGSAAQAVGELAGQLPKVGAFLRDHKTLFLAMGAGFVGFKALAGIGGMIEKTSKIPGLGGLVGAGGGKGLPVYVTNWGGKEPSLPGVGDALKNGKKFLPALAAGGVASGLALAAAGAAAGYGGGKLGLFLNNHSTTVNKFYSAEANLLDRIFSGGRFAKLENFEVERNKRLVQEQANKRKSLVDSLEAAGLSHGQAVAIATGANKQGFDVQRGDQTIHISLNADGKVLADVVVPHITRHVRNTTADGTAPTWRG